MYTHTTFFTAVLVATTAGVMFVSTTPCAAQTATTASGSFSLQGELTTSSGTPLPDGKHVITSTVNVQGSASAVFTEMDTVTTTKGMFSVMIGANGMGGTKLHVRPDTSYELGISVDGTGELSPRLSLQSALKSMTAELSSNSNLVGGFGVSSADSARANTVLVLNGNGKIHTTLLDSGMVTSINGASGALSITGSANLSVNKVGNALTLSLVGGSSDTLALPFLNTVSFTSGSVISLTNTQAATVGSFVNTGTGMGLSVQALTGTAINATSSGNIGGAATIDVTNIGTTAINATAKAPSDAVLKIKNIATNASALLMTASDFNGNAVVNIEASGKTAITSSSDVVLKLKNTSVSGSTQILSGADAAGNVVLNVETTGKTTIASSVDKALTISTSLAGGTALDLTGGLRLTGPVGTGVVPIGQTAVTISNSLVKAGSMIFITVTGGGAATVPLQVTGQAAGSFVVGVFNAVPALTGNVTFSYLVVN